MLRRPNQKGVAAATPYQPQRRRRGVVVERHPQKDEATSHLHFVSARSRRSRRRRRTGAADWEDVARLVAPERSGGGSWKFLALGFYKDGAPRALRNLVRVGNPSLAALRGISLRIQVDTRRKVKLLLPS